MKKIISVVFATHARRLLGIYLGVVLIFAISYQLVWKMRPDAFIVHDEFNQFPTEQLWQGLGYSGQSPSLPLTSDDVAKLPEGAALRPAISEWHRSKMSGLAQLADLKNRIVEAKAAWDEADARAGKSWSVAVEAFKNKETGAAQAEVQRLSSEITALEERFPRSNGMRTSEGEYQIAVARGNLTKAELRLSQRQVEMYSQITAQPHAFDDQKLREGAKKAYEVLMAFEQDFDRLKREDIRLNKMGFDLWSQRGRTVHSRIGFLDFVYFSLGVSTTTTFGDIIPNSQWARSLVIMQLLSCTVIVGVFVSHIGARALGKSGP